jgi:hypothetical protein
MTDADIICDAAEQRYEKHNVKGERDSKKEEEKNAMPY